MKTTHHCQDLIAIFNDLFMDSENTILIGNGEEPLYLPCDKVHPYNRIIFTRNYFSSALHEVAHWCIASDERRKQVDYGYWYFPEGRSEEQQMLFEKAEIKPQAIEYIFSQSVGLKFNVSQDNLATGHGNTALFEKNVAEQALQYLTFGLPPRAELFRNKLIALLSLKSGLKNAIR